LLLLHRRPPCVVKHKLYPGFTHFRGILSLMQVYIFEIYTKFCVFWYPSWGGLKKFFLTPLMCGCAFWRPRQGEGARSTKIFLPVSHFLHQNETTSGWQDPKIKFSLKINSPYCILYCIIYCILYRDAVCLAWCLLIIYTICTVYSAVLAEKISHAQFTWCRLRNLLYRNLIHLLYIEERKNSVKWGWAIMLYHTVWYLVYFTLHSTV
jgi:hypothetical protein